MPLWQVAVSYIKVRADEAVASDSLVLDNLHKRSEVRRQFEPLVEFMMAQSMPTFMEYKRELQVVLSGLHQKWSGGCRNVAGRDRVRASGSAVDTRGTFDDRVRRVDMYEAIDQDDVMNWLENADAASDLLSSPDDNATPQLWKLQGRAVEVPASTIQTPRRAHPTMMTIMMLRYRCRMLSTRARAVCFHDLLACSSQPKVSSASGWARICLATW